MYCQLNQCCCGCSLRTGATAIGVFSLIASVVSIIRIAFVFSALEGNSSSDAELLYNYNVGQLVGAVASICMTVLVLVVAWKNRMPNLMLPWLFAKIVAIIVMFSYLIFLVMVGIVSAGGMEGVYLLIVCAGGALGFYFWLVVLSYYQELNVKAKSEELPGEKAITGPFQLD